MGLFNFFRNKSAGGVTKLEDSMWLSNEAKLDGIIAAINEIQKSNKYVLVISHFEETFNEIERVIKNTGQSYIAYRDALNISDVVNKFTERKSPIIISCSNIVFDDSAYIANDDEFSIEVIVVERYPMRIKDENIVSVINKLPFPTTISFHNSMYDGFLKLFATDNVVNLIKKLGIGDNESINNAWVSTGVKILQEKISNNGGGEIQASSQEEWLDKNDHRITDIFPDYIPSHKKGWQSKEEFNIQYEKIWHDSPSNQFRLNNGLEDDKQHDILQIDEDYGVRIYRSFVNKATQEYLLSKATSFSFDEIETVSFESKPKDLEIRFEGGNYILGGALLGGLGGLMVGAIANSLINAIKGPKNIEFEFVVEFKLGNDSIHEFKILEGAYGVGPENIGEYREFVETHISKEIERLLNCIGKCIPAKIS